MSETNTVVSADHARRMLGNRDWIWANGYWSPTIQVVETKPEITPGNYTMEEALAFYGYKLEED